MASATIKYNIHDYFSADTVLKGRPQKKIGNNTWLIREDDLVIAVKYHRTFIARFHLHWVEFFTGGWLTYTTKDRLNQLIPVPWSIYQEKHQWYVRNRQTDDVVPWREGIMFLTNRD